MGAEVRLWVHDPDAYRAWDQRHAEDAEVLRAAAEVLRRSVTSSFAQASRDEHERLILADRLEAAAKGEKG